MFSYAPTLPACLRLMLARIRAGIWLLCFLKISPAPSSLEIPKIVEGRTMYDLTLPCSAATMISRWTLRWGWMEPRLSMEAMSRSE